MNLKHYPTAQAAIAAAHKMANKLGHAVQVLPVFGKAPAPARAPYPKKKARKYIRQEMHAGRPRKQAVAIGIARARRNPEKSTAEYLAELKAQGWKDPTSRAMFAAAAKGSASASRKLLELVERGAARPSGGRRKGKQGSLFTGAELGDAQRDLFSRKKNPKKKKRAPARTKKKRTKKKKRAARARGKRRGARRGRRRGK